MDSIVGKVVQDRQHIAEIGKGMEGCLLAAAFFGEEAVSKDSVRPGGCLKVGATVADVNDMAALLLVTLHD